MKRRLTILVALWKRPDLSRLMLNHTQRVVAEVNAALHDDDEVCIQAVISADEDPGSVDIVHGLGIPAVRAPNAPLSAKWGAGMKALENQTGAVMLLGSDDFVTAPFVRAAWDSMFRDNNDVFGCEDFFFCGAGPRVLRWSGYSADSGRLGEPMGAGRCFSARLLDILKWTPWPNGLANGLDGACWNKVLAAAEFFPIKFDVGPIAATGGMLMDVKRPGEEQMSAFSRYEDRGEDVPWQNVMRHFDPALVEALALDPMPAFHERQARFRATTVGPAQ